MHSRMTYTSVLRPTSATTSTATDYYQIYYDGKDYRMAQYTVPRIIHYMYTAYIFQYAICCIFVPSIKTASTQQLRDISSAFVLETGMRGGF